MIDHLRALVRDDLESVQNVIKGHISSDEALLHELSSYILQSGGKQVRPLLVLISSHACGPEEKNHILLAAMIELFHTATLLHDDVVDESTLRRGKKTANTVWGNKASILVGDYLFTQFMQLMITVGDLKIMRVMTDITHQIGCGEIKQLANKHNTKLSVADYLDIIRAKTSLLFAAAAKLGAIVNAAGDDIEEALFSYGLHLGNAFQLTDDALDYSSDSEIIGKNIGDDLADGKATMPLLYALQEGTETAQNQIRQGLTQGSLDYLPEIQKAIEETGAIEYTLSQAKEEIDDAIKALQILPDSVYKKGLTSLAEYVLSRTH